MSNGLKFATSVMKSFNANPRTGAPMPKFGQAGQAVIPAGSLPKRSRGGGAGNPLARIPKEVLEAFQGLKAPRLLFRTMGDGQPCSAVDEHGETLTPRIGQGGEVHFYNVRGDEVTDVLFRTEATEEHPEGETYTPDGVEPLEELDKIPVEGPPETVNKIYSAMQIFNKATGKALRMLLDRNIYDDKGNIVSQVKVIWRTA